MNVLIWGYYQKGNFGDDAMGVMFAEYLKKLGHTPILFTKGKYFRLPEGTEACDDLDILEDIGAVVLGGGGLMNELSFLRKIRFLKSRLFGSEESELSLIQELNKWLEKRNLKIIPISIGGGGKRFGHEKIRLLKNNSIPGTVRLNSDIRVLDELGIEGFIHCPDILWRTPDFFGSDAAIGEKSPTIGFNMKKRDSAGSLKNRIDEFCNERQVTPANVTSHVDRVKYGYENEFSDIETIAYQGSVDAFVAKLRKLSVVVSSKLHVGLAAMSFGVPFVSFQGPVKARIALEELGLGRFVCHDEDGLFRCLNEIMENFELVRNEMLKIAERESDLALIHFDRLSTALHDAPPL